MTLHRTAALLLLAAAACAHDQPKPAPAAQPSAASSAIAAQPSTGATAPPAGATTTQSGPPLYPAQETPDAAYRAEKPPPLSGELRFEAPVPVERRLRNGARLLVSELHAVPIVSIDVLFATGINCEPLGKGGLAGFVASMVSEARCMLSRPGLDAAGRRCTNAPEPRRILGVSGVCEE